MTRLKDLVLATISRDDLKAYIYPPDKQERATQTVLEQAEALSSEWVNAPVSGLAPTWR